MSDLSFISCCSELFTPWNEEDEANFDLGLDPDESDELYESFSMAIGDPNHDMCMSIEGLDIVE